MHSIGPKQVVKEFMRVVFNGTNCIRNHEDKKKAQNYGVSICSEDGFAYYGPLTCIIENMYYDGSRYVLFKYGWHYYG